ncbi:MAG: tetratricopeptide repeat protein [Cyanobacteria bacterium P01_H01_bin.21]
MAQPFVPPTYEYQNLASQAEPADYWQQVGTNAVVIGEYQNALAALNKAVDLTEAREPELLEQRGWVHYRLGNERLASADLRAAAALYLAEQSYKDYVNARNILRFVDS